MDLGVDAALARVAAVLRLIGAAWTVALLVAAATADQLDAPLASGVVVVVAAAWAVVAWRGGLLATGAGSGPTVLAMDVAVAVSVIVVPGLLGEGAQLAGGYPFATLVVALAVAGRRGVVVVVAALCAATVVNLLSSGRLVLASVTSSVLLYVFGAVMLVLGVELLRRQESRARAAEAALAVERERAAVATHLHDSVLQTLALVQRRAGDADGVRALARRQERELRQWLFAEQPHAGEGASPRLRGELDALAERIQADHGVAVSVVVAGGAGDVPVPEGDDGVAALVLAVGEAVTNAAVHASAATVDVYAEVADGGLNVWVRDRGAGFDPAEVPADRQGVRASIIGRMRRVGGAAKVTSQPGRGTEVRLRLDDSEYAHG